MEKKKKGGRRAYLNDFLRDGSGDYRYTGKTYRYDFAKTGYRVFLLRAWGIAAAMAAAVIACGCLPVSGMYNCFYVLLPYAAEVGAAGSVIWALVRITAGGGELREYVYAATVPKLPLRGLLSAVFAGVGALGYAVYMVINGDDSNIMYIILYYLMKIVVVSCGCVIQCSRMSEYWIPSGVSTQMEK